MAWAAENSGNPRRRDNAHPTLALRSGASVSPVGLRQPRFRSLAVRSRRTAEGPSWYGLRRAQRRPRPLKTLQPPTRLVVGTGTGMGSVGDAVPPAPATVRAMPKPRFRTSRARQTASFRVAFARLPIPFWRIPLGRQTPRANPPARPFRPFPSKKSSQNCTILKYNGTKRNEPAQHATRKPAANPFLRVRAPAARRRRGAGAAPPGKQSPPALPRAATNRTDAPLPRSPPQPEREPCP